MKRKTKKDTFEGQIVGKLNEEDFFDNCPVCQEMKSLQKKGKIPTQSELKETFEKAKQKGAIVGGEWFEKP